MKSFSLLTHRSEVRGTAAGRHFSARRLQNGAFCENNQVWWYNDYCPLQMPNNIYWAGHFRTKINSSCQHSGVVSNDAVLLHNQGFNLFNLHLFQPWFESFWKISENKAEFPQYVSKWLVMLWKCVIAPFFDIYIKNVNNDFVSLCFNTHLFYVDMSGPSFLSLHANTALLLISPRDPVILCITLSFLNGGSFSWVACVYQTMRASQKTFTNPAFNQ